MNQVNFEISSEVRNAHVALLINFIMPNQKHVFEQLSKQVKQLTILVSTTMEPNRSFDADWSNLEVIPQSNLMLTRKWKHHGEFSEDNYIHIPWKTVLELRKLKPDVVVSYEMGFRTLLASLYCGKKTPFVVVGNMSEHTESDRGKVRPRMRRLIRNKSSVATFNGPSCKRYMESIGFESQNLFEYPYSADPDKISLAPRTEKSGPLNLFYANSLTSRKNIDNFCVSLIKWCKSNPAIAIKFTIAGKGPLQSTIEELELPDNLTFDLVGFVSAQELAEHFAACDIYTYPTLADEWGLGTEEALASGVPVLVSEFAQSTEALVSEGVNGWIFDPHQDSSLQTAFDRAFNLSRSELLAMETPAREATKGYSPSISAQKLCIAIQTAMRMKSGTIREANAT